MSGTRMTMAKLAEKAGISKTVVSTILNNKENQRVFVSPETKSRVLELVDQYGYVPQRSARSLTNRRADAVALIAHSASPYFSHLLLTLQKEALKEGLDVLPYITEEEDKEEERILRQLLDGRVDGVITVGLLDQSEERYRNYLETASAPPLICLAPPLDGIPTIHFNEALAGRLAVDHLLSIGCQHIGIVSMSVRSGRGASAFQAAQKKGVKTSVVKRQENHHRCGWEECKFLGELAAELDPLPDGIFAYNDLVALALIAALLRRGVRIPEDVAVIGCDNTEACQYAYPTLSSVDTNAKAVAKTTLRLLKKKSNGKEIPKETKINNLTVYVRESSRRGKR